METKKQPPFSESPLSGKLRFRLRSLNNFLFALVVFVPVVFAVAHFSGGRMWVAWLADAALIGLLYYAYGVFLNRRAIWIRCPHCTKSIATNTPWVCGSCHERNERVDHFPFVHRCQHCEVEPKAYQCHHASCEKLIFLTKDELSRNFAFCINPDVAPTEEEKDRYEFEAKKRKMTYELQLTALTGELNATKQKVEDAGAKKKGPQEKIEASWEKRKAQSLSAAEIYRREKAANEEKYKGDPEMLKSANEALEEWYKSGDWERVI